MLKRLQLPIIFISIALFIANLIVLDILFIIQNKNNSGVSEEVSSPVETAQKSDQPCSSDCISQTPQATPTITPTAKPINSTVFNQNVSQVKDFMISLGAGTGQSSDWTDVPGVGATINSDSYKNIKNVFFEVSLILPTTNNIVSLRLYNVTDKHPVWYSQIDSNGEKTAYLSSQKIQLDSGSKLYQVQMKTLLTDQPTTLVQSRIHIITN